MYGSIYRSRMYIDTCRAFGRARLTTIFSLSLAHLNILDALCIVYLAGVGLTAMFHCEIAGSPDRCQ
jgi:hypothetical protein